MKHPICHFAQRRLDTAAPSGRWLAEHVRSCPDCQRHVAESRQMRQQLFSLPDDADEFFCREIMTAIAGAKVAPSKPEIPPLHFRAWIAVGATAVVALIAAALVRHFEPLPESAVLAQGPPPPEPMTRTPVRELPDQEDPLQSLAHNLVQSELLLRDARKLGIHLRENVILFHPSH
jgi:hypothetical protein